MSVTLLPTRKQFPAHGTLQEVPRSSDGWCDRALDKGGWPGNVGLRPGEDKILLEILDVAWMFNNLSRLTQLINTKPKLEKTDFQGPEAQAEVCKRVVTRCVPEWMAAVYWTIAVHSGKGKPNRQESRTVPVGHDNPEVICAMPQGWTSTPEKHQSPVPPALMISKSCLSKAPCRALVGHSLP